MLTTRMPWDNDDVMIEKDALKAEQLVRLRDEFAMAALTGAVASEYAGQVNAKVWAESAYYIADEMLIARSRP